MATIRLNANSQPACIPIPSWFIHNYMPKAMGGYIKVYLYLVAAFYEQHEVLSIEEIATLLSMLSSEVIGALEYWQEQKILTFNAISTDDFEVNFIFSPSPKAQAPDIQDHTQAPVHTRNYVEQTRPNYSPTELTIYLQDPEVQKLYKTSEKALGRLLSSSDQQILFGLYDWLHMPIDLIEYLLDYCATKGHTSMRYIEKTAIGWINDGITTLEHAKMRSQADKVYFKILSEVGLGTQNITKVQKEFIDTWLHTYNLSLEVILEGCRRAAAQAQNPSLKYLNAIFKDWHKNNVSSLEDIKKLDAAFISKQQLQATPVKQPSKAPVKKTTFNTIQGRDWDFNELERLERDRMKRLLNEGS